MGWRKTGTFRPPEEILVMTCDMCERDIGHEDQRRPKAHYEIVRLPNPGAMGEQAPAIFACSAECLRAFAAKASREPDPPPPRPSRGGSTRKPKR